jgi:hypothetical protein
VGVSLCRRRAEHRGRSVATIAELCFVAQWALMLRHTSRETGCVTARVTSYVVLPLIVIAEMCSWYSVLTTRRGMDQHFPDSRGGTRQAAC